MICGMYRYQIAQRVWEKQMQPIQPITSSTSNRPLNRQVRLHFAADTSQKPSNVSPQKAYDKRGMIFTAVNAVLSIVLMAGLYLYHVSTEKTSEPSQKPKTQANSPADKGISQ